MESNNKGYELNEIPTSKIQDIIAMAIAERNPLEKAYVNLINSVSRKTVNDYLGKLNLHNYIIEDIYIDVEISFDKDTVINAIREYIEKEDRQKNFLSQKLENLWSTNIRSIIANLVPENPETFVEWARQEARKEVENDSSEGCLFPLLLSLLLAQVPLFLIFLLSSRYSSFTNYVSWLNELITSFFNSKHNTEYYWHAFLGIMGYLFLALLCSPIAGGILLILKEWKMNNIIENSVKQRITQASQIRFQRTMEILSRYVDESFVSFYEDQAYKEIFPSSIPNDFWHEAVALYQSWNEKSNIVKSWRASYPSEEIDILFDQVETWEKERTIYNERINNGSSFEMILPKPYQDSKLLSEIHYLISVGRADSWKEAVNLLHSTKFQENLVASIRNVYSSIDNLSYELQTIGTSIRKDLEWSAQQTIELQNSTDIQNKILSKQTSLIENQNILTRDILMMELLK